MTDTPEQLPFSDNLPDVLTCDEAADVLRVSIDRVWALIRSGDLKAFRVGKPYRIMRADFEDFITRNTNQN